MSQPDESGVLQDIKRVSDKLGKKPTEKEYNEKGNYHSSAALRRCGSWNKALEEAGLGKFKRSSPEFTEEQINQVESYLKDKQGRFKSKKLRQELKEKCDINLYNRPIKTLRNRINQRDNGIEIGPVSKGGKAGGSMKIFISNENLDRYSDLKSKLPDSAECVFEELVKFGKNPKTTAAAILYLTEGNEYQTQKDAANEVDCNTVSLRDMRDEIVEKDLDKRLN